MSVILHCDKCGANRLDSCHCSCATNISSLSDELKDCHERHIQLAEENLRLTERDKKYWEIFTWLLGENGDFPLSLPGRRYNFRTELRKRLEALAEPGEGAKP